MSFPAGGDGQDGGRRATCAVLAVQPPLLRSVLEWLLVRRGWQVLGSSPEDRATTADVTVIRRGLPMELAAVESPVVVVLPDQGGGGFVHFRGPQPDVVLPDGEATLDTLFEVLERMA